MSALCTTSRSSKCWICPEKLETTKSLKAHIAIQHYRLSVTCPDCHGQERIFKRVSDLKCHYMKAHPHGSLPDEAFTERNGFWMALYPEDYIRVIQPTARSDEVARKTKAAITSMLSQSASSCRRKKYREEWYKGWELERESYQPETPSQDTPKYVPTPTEIHKTSPDIVRTKRPRSVTPVPSQSMTPAAATASPLVAGSPAFDPDYEVEAGSSGLVPENSVSILKINLLPGDCHAYLKEGAVFFKVGLSDEVFSCPRTMQVLARRMATLDLEESGPSSSTIFISCQDQGKIEAVVSVLGLPSSMILTTLMSETQFEPPAKRQRTDLSIQERASELLKKGCFPLFQPARREWSEMEPVTLKAGQVSISWPPPGWKDLSRDVKLLQWEVAAYKLAEATRDSTTVIPMSRSDLLDRFNFLALPGTAGHHITKATRDAACTRFYMYEKLRQAASAETDQPELDSWLKIIECGTQMREVTEDSILEQIEDIPLRLQESS